MSQPALPGLGLPHNVTAESHCLGGMIFRRSNVPLVVDTGLEPGHFFLPEHAREYGRVVESWINDEDPDPGLGRDGITGYVYNAAQVSRPDLYAVEIIDLAEQRHVILQATGRAVAHIGWPEWWAARREARLP